MHLQGSILTSSSLLQGDYFENASIFIARYDGNGATGFIINRLFPRKLNELVEFSQAAGLDIWEGGPVNPEHLYFIHSVPQLYGQEIAGGVYLGGDFPAAVALASAGKISSAQLKIFIGYCGWDAAGLEAELAEGSWRHTSLPPTSALEVNSSSF